MTRRLFTRLGGFLLSATQGPQKAWPELLQAFALLSGWALLTWGIASLTVWQTWPISGGLLLLSVVGLGFLKQLFGAGLYTLSRTGKGAKRG